MTTTELLSTESPPLSSRPYTQRLLVTRQDQHRMYRPVGFLDAQAGDPVQYRFAYLRSAVAAPEFQPLLGFRDLHRQYVSEGLFPLFAERLMDPRRPDRATFLAALDLAPTASPLTILERSGGHRLGDHIELLPLPAATHTGEVECTFLVHGIRYIEQAEARIARLRSGDELRLQHQPDNPANSRAVLVLNHEPNGELGWVPNALADAVHDLRESRVTVVRVNGPEVGPRFRLLVRLQGNAEPDWAPFSGPEWTTTA